MIKYNYKYKDVYNYKHKYKESKEILWHLKQKTKR